MHFDTIIRNGNIVDGTGAPWRRGDVGIKGGRIARIGALAEAKCDSEIDGTGLFVSPGFIDIHSHLDFCVLSTPRMESSVYQGITTEIAGQCGQSVAPAAPDDAERIKRFYEYQWHGTDFKWDWKTLGDFLDRLEQQPTSLNFGMCVGHQTLRLATMGFECRRATGAEIKQLKSALRQALRDGAFGMTSGAQFAPGFFSDTEELVELGKVVAEHGGYYAAHMRSEGDKLLEAVAEVIEVGERAGVSAQISHLKAAGKANFGKVNAALRMVEKARERGIDILVDTQPYGALDRQYAAEMMWMRSCIPPWRVAEAGGFEVLREKLKDPAFRELLKQEIEERRSPNWNSFICDCMLKDVGFENLVLGQTEAKAYKRYFGKSIAQIARETKRDNYDTYFQLLIDEPIPSSALYFMLDPDDVRAVVTSPYTIPMVDVGYRFMHPRKWGCFPRYLTQYVREEKRLTLEEAIRKITSFPAGRLGLSDRGQIKEQFWADIVVFDWKTLNDCADFANFDRRPTGIPYVLVNGIAVIKDGEHTGARPGMALRKK